MLAYTAADVDSYLTRELKLFEKGRYAVIIVDGYYGGGPEQRSFIDNLISFLQGTVDVCKIVWFYNRDLPISFTMHPSVEAKDYSTFFTGNRLGIHDRFMFVYDADAKAYVKLFHIGASFNGFDIEDKSNTRIFNIFRISPMDEVNLNDSSDPNQKLIKLLENLYGRKEWGCS